MYSYIMYVWFGCFEPSSPKRPDLVPSYFFTFTVLKTFLQQCSFKERGELMGSENGDSDV